MIVQANVKHLLGVKPHEYAVRFVFGGVCTVAAGLIAQHWGAAAGGLFLAFPAIFPAGASLIEKHEIEHKRRIGADGTARGRQVAGIDALGAALGSVGLAGFAAVVWLLLPGHNAVEVIAGATGVWAAIGMVLWLGYKKHLLRRRA